MGSRPKTTFLSRLSAIAAGQNMGSGVLAQVLVEGAPIEIRPGRILDVARHVTSTPSSQADTTIFFAHGAGGNKNQWRYQWQSVVEAGYNAVAWDSLGHGASPRPETNVTPSPYRSDETLRDYAAIFERYKSARNVLVAHSTAIESTLCLLSHLANRGMPRDVSAALMLGMQRTRPGPGTVRERPAWVRPLVKSMQASRVRELGFHPLADPRLVAYEERVASKNTWAIVQAVVRETHPVPDEALAELRTPVIFVSGDLDRLARPADTHALADRLPLGLFIELPECGHQVMLEKPAAVNRILSDTLATLEHAAQLMHA